MAWSTPLTAVANVALTAAQWNASVRDNLNFLHRAIDGVSATKTSDTSVGTSDATVVSAPSITGDGSSKVKITISWFGITPNAGITVGKCMIQEGATNLAQCRWETASSSSTSSGGSLSVIVTPSAASHTYQFSAIRESGPSGTVLSASSTTPATIMVEQFL